MTPEERTQILNTTIFQWGTKGFTAEAVMPPNAILSRKEKVNHILHFILSFFLCGFWLPIWLFLALSSKDERYQLFVDENGNTSSTKLKN